MNVIASGSFNEDMIPTVGFNMRKITKGNVTIKLWDIGGQVCKYLKFPFRNSESDYTSFIPFVSIMVYLIFILPP